MEDERIEWPYKPNNGYGGYAALFTCGAICGLAIGWLAYLACSRWPDWWLIIGACSICSFLIGLACLVALVLGTWAHIIQCITLMRLNRKELERRSTFHNNQKQQINED